MIRSFAFAGVLLFAATCYSQAPASTPPPAKHHFSRFRLDMGVGAGGTQSAYKVNVDLSQVDESGPVHNPQQFTWPVLFVEAEYALGEEFALGIHYDFWQEERWFKISNDRAVFHNTINTWLVSARHYWNGHSHLVQMYSGVMAGPSFEHYHSYKIDGVPTSDVTRMAIHATLIGMRLGRHAGCTMEFGIGTKGLFSTALSVAF